MQGSLAENSTEVTTQIDRVMEGIWVVAVLKNRFKVTRNVN